MSAARRHAASQDWGPALQACATIQRDGDQATQEAVDGARQAGWTWQQIADMLGVTQQAAHKRYGPKAKQRREQRQQEDATPPA